MRTCTLTLSVWWERRVQSSPPLGQPQPSENQSVIKIIDPLLTGEWLHSCILWSLERHKLLSIFIMLFTLMMIDHSKLSAKLNMIIYRESPAWCLLLLNNEVDLRN